MRLFLLSKWYDIKYWYYTHKGIFWSFFTLFILVVGFFSYFYITMENDKESLKAKEISEIDTNIKEPNLTEEAYIIKELKPPEIIEEKAAPEEGSVSVLFLGIDSRQDNLVGRSDSMVLLTASKTDNSVKLLSIPRDAYVPIAGKGYNDKITHAHAFGGDEMAQKTVENLLGIKIDHHVVFNFFSFVKVIDALGGIEVNVPFNFTEKSHTGKVISFRKGKNVLNGTEALAYARMRHQDPRGDLGRGERQQQIIKAVIKKAASFSSVTKFKDVYNIVNKSVKTDVVLLNLVELVPHIKGIKNVSNINLSGYGKKINGIYYMELNENELNKARKEIHNHLGMDNPS